VGRHVDTIDCLAVGPEERSVATGDRSGTIRVWSLESTHKNSSNGEPAWLFSRASHHGRVESLAFAKDELVSVGDDGRMSRTNAHSVESVRRISIPGWRDVFTGFRLADNGTMLYWCEDDGAEPKYTAAIQRDGSATAWTEKKSDATIHLRRRAGQPEEAPLSVDLPPKAWIERLDFIPDTPLLLVRTYGSNHDLLFYDLVQRRRVLENFSPQANLVAFSRDGKRIAYEYQKVVTVADFPSLDHRVKLQGHLESIEAIALSQDASILVTGSGDRKIRSWNAQTGEELHLLEDHRAPVLAVAISPDTKTLASGDATGRIKLWHLSTGKLLFDLPRVGDECSALAFSADGSRLVAGFLSNKSIFEFLTRREPPVRTVINCQVISEAEASTRAAEHVSR
jgi:WD40 repeat protein